ncbi:hypothetical protein QAD02_010751 [Eretmocerus hayati]|uniref:Uncharacterized protein n=1 Tax=Eretmocerus hayati TaxID=131215 RepID=A0ACC2NUN4_9HYME|nr:hypothetical protein QAD02_010751 [Eretmocerus hayati]
MASCESSSINHLNVNYDEQYKGFIVDKNKVDLILANTLICGSLDFCKISFIDGILRDSVSPFNFSENFYAAALKEPNVKFVGFPAANDSLDESFFALCSNDNDTEKQQILYINGKAKKESTPLSDQDVTLGHVLSTSNAYNFFSWCQVNNKKSAMRCFQYNWENDKLLQNSFELGGWIPNVAITNLSGGGYRLLITLCINLKSVGLCKSFYMPVINSVGGSIKPFSKLKMHVLNLPCESKIPPQIKTSIVDLENEFCAYFTCKNADKNYFLNRCFSKDE